MQKSLSLKAKMCILFVVLVFLPFLVFVIKVLSKRLSENLFFSFTGYGATELLLSAGGSYLRHTEKSFFVTPSRQAGDILVTSLLAYP